MTGKRIVLGVTGGIAAYKSADLVRRLRDAGADVRVVMTAGARAFVTPLTFQAVSGHPVHTDLLDAGAEAGMGHIELARWADRVLIAPATADFLARLAHGLADDLLTTLCLATEASLLAAPAMNQQMWANPATQHNCELLRQRGVRLLGPAEGSQACGDVGPGRMLEPAALVVAVLGSDVAAADTPASALTRALTRALAGRHVVVTAGPTYEDIDPVRFIGNRSSGRMGFAVAEAAAAAGARVSLVAGPVQLPTPPGVERTDVRGAREMHQTALALAGGADVFFAVAAVADYTPKNPAGQKIKKGATTLHLELVATPDIVADVAALPERPFTVGFAAETENLEAHAAEKLSRKSLDMIAANRVGQEGSGFESENNALLLLSPQGTVDLGHGSKPELALKLVGEVAKRLEKQGRKPK